MPESHKTLDFRGWMWYLLTEQKDLVKKETAMKRLCSVLLVLIGLVLLLSGCARARITLDVKSTGTVDLTMEIAVSKTLQDSLGSGSFDILGDDSIASYIEDGATVTPYSDGDYVGYVITKKDISPSGEKLFDSSVSIRKEGGRYILDIPWNTGDEDGSAQTLIAAGSLISAQGGYAEIVVKLPTKPLSHNATSEADGGKTLIWNLLAMGDRTSLHIEYSAGSLIWFWVWRIAAVIAAAALLVVLILLIIRFAKSRKAKKNKSEDSDLSELRKYKEMLDENLISQEDYDRKKMLILEKGSDAGAAPEDDGRESQ